jgi:hypothetical protein
MLSGPLRRALPLWVALVAAYALTLAVPGHGTTAPEAHRLLAVDTLVAHGGVDVRESYTSGAWRDFYDGDRLSRPARAPAVGRWLEPVGLGFVAVVAPAYWIGGELGVRIFLMMVFALGFCLAAALGRRLVPEPWPTRAALALGLSPPAVGAATAIAPATLGATVLAGAALLAPAVRDEPRRRTAFFGAALVAALPWLATELLVPAAVVALALARWLRRRQRGLAGFIALEVALTSAVVYVTISDRLYGGLTPHDVAAGGATGASGVVEHLERAGRLATAWVSDEGLLLWAPLTALAGVALWRLWRSHRERLSVAVVDQADVEVAALFYALVILAVWLTAVFAAPSLDGAGRSWSHARHLIPALPPLAALVAWGWRFAPRAGTALAALTVAMSVALLASHA